MKKIILLIATACLATVSCTDDALTALDGRLTDSEKELQALGERISTVEQTLLQLNTDIRSLLFLSGGITVNKAEGNDTDGWMLTLGDGRKVTIPPQGPKGNAPVISQDDEGYWMVNYGDGPAYILDNNGNKVNQAGKGDNGHDAEFSPILGVTEDGYWQISYDGGIIWSLLLDVNGEFVPTKIEVGETLFQSVDVKDYEVTMTLKSGESFTLPLVKNFMCAIQGVTGIEQFSAGQTKEYTVQMEGIIELFVTGPNEWSTVLSGNTLSVTAPSATKVYFDTDEYVSIYAVSVDGHSVISSMKVAITE